MSDKNEQIKGIVQELIRDPRVVKSDGVISDGIIKAKIDAFKKIWDIDPDMPAIECQALIVRETYSLCEDASQLILTCFAIKYASDSLSGDV